MSLLVTRSPQPLLQPCAAQAVKSALLPGMWTVKLEKEESIVRFSPGAFHTADLPVTSLSLQLSATFTADVFMQNNLTSPPSSNCLPQSLSLSKNASGLFTCSPCCLTQSCSWHPVLFDLVQTRAVPQGWIPVKTYMATRYSQPS